MEVATFFGELAKFWSSRIDPKLSAEFDQLPWVWGLKKLILLAGYLNEILKAVPGERPIKTVQSLRKNLSRLGWELSKYVERNP
jgi:hypothetical protein